MEENTNLRWRSTIPGRFHGCGHDGHTTMLLGTARYLAETRNFDGTVHFIFQPAEEGLGGARAMIKDGLFEKFPCDEVYGLHNAPDLNHGEIAILPGPAMAGADFFDITINGYGAHGAMPNFSKDPIVIAMSLGQALQTIVSRNVNPHEPAVLSITQIHAGSAYNVIPGEAKLCGTVRAFSDEVRALIRERMKAICAGMASTFQVEIIADIRDTFSVLVNQEEQSRVVEASGAHGGRPGQGHPPGRTPKMGSEDFADMLHAVPGAYFWIGHEGSVPVHNPGYVLDDKILPIGASMFARIIETRLPVAPPMHEPGIAGSGHFAARFLSAVDLIAGSPRQTILAVGSAGGRAGACRGMGAAYQGALRLRSGWRAGGCESFDRPLEQG